MNGRRGTLGSHGPGPTLSPPSGHLRARAGPGQCPGPKRRRVGDAAARGGPGAPTSATPPALTWLRGGRADSEQQGQGREHVQEALPPRPQPGPPESERPQVRAPRAALPPARPRDPAAPRSPHLGAMLGRPDRLRRGCCALRRGAPARPAAFRPPGTNRVRAGAGRGGGRPGAGTGAAGGRPGRAEGRAQGRMRRGGEQHQDKPGAGRGADRNRALAPPRGSRAVSVHPMRPVGSGCSLGQGPAARSPARRLSGGVLAAPGHRSSGPNRVGAAGRRAF